MADMRHDDETDERQTALILEIELPEFYAEDLRPDNASWQEWLAMADVDPADVKAVGQEILHNIGEVYCGLLTIEVSGEKDSEIVRLPVVMVGARVEDRPPDMWTDGAQHLAEKIDERHEETIVLGKMYHAELWVLQRFVRQLKDEYTGQVSQLAEQALQEAQLASDAAEARWAPS
jgi:hypothetical protein